MWMGAMPQRLIVSQTPAKMRAGSVVRQATKRTTAAPRKDYSGPVNPKLRALLQSSEYRSVVELMIRLNEEGVLKEFLQKAEAYWQEVNIFDLALKEKQGGGREILNAVRSQWPRIWPEKLPNIRMEAFDRFSKFWTRLGSSRVLDDVLGEVLPDMRKGYSGNMKSKDRDRLSEMTDKQRREEIFKRLSESVLLRQFSVLSKSDDEVKTISPTVGPTLARMVVITERKLADQTAELGSVVNSGVLAVGVLVVLLILVGFGIIPNPLGQEDAPSFDAPGQENRSEIADQFFKAASEAGL